jgi:hypothetical protein
MAHAVLRTVEGVPSRLETPSPDRKTPSSAGRILSIPPALTNRNVYPFASEGRENGHGWNQEPGKKPYFAARSGNT